DEPLVMAAVTMLVVMLVVGNLIADLLLAVIDPRIRVE
ncbi:MAG TPA: ABC transporter permease, partial [Blastocatellia bacterium]